MDGWKEGERTIPLTIQPTSSLELRSVLFSSIVPSMRVLRTSKAA